MEPLQGLLEFCDRGQVVLVHGVPGVGRYLRDAFVFLVPVFERGHLVASAFIMRASFIAWIKPSSLFICRLVWILSLVSRAL